MDYHESPDGKEDKRCHLIVETRNIYGKISQYTSYIHLLMCPYKDLAFNVTLGCLRLLYHEFRCYLEGKAVS